jgi:RNA polymerase sigma-70 factor (ECF subfamily)
MTAGGDLSDVQLLKCAARGDEEAFTSLYRRRQGGVYRFALQMSGRPGIAEEVTQDVFLTLVRDGFRYDESRGAVSSYLLGIARNLTLRALEREGLLLEMDEPTVSPDPGPLDGLVLSETVEAVRRAVLSLPASYREAVVLCDLQELSYADAARALGCPVGTVRSKLNRGRALLCEKLAAAKRYAV